METTVSEDEVVIVVVEVAIGMVDVTKTKNPEEDLYNKKLLKN